MDAEVSNDDRRLARRSHLAKTGAADGEVVWSRCLDADINLAMMLWLCRPFGPDTPASRGGW